MRPGRMGVIISSALLLCPLLSYGEGPYYYEYENEGSYYEEPVNNDYRDYRDEFPPDPAPYKAERDESASFHGRGSSELPAYTKSQAEKVIIIDPRLHEWGAYSASGKLVRSGLATAGAGWCRDIGKSCRTKTGTFRIYSAGDASCYSSKFPLPDGGAPMPYCMYFNGGQAIHGSDNVVYGNVSHGCVRVHVSDAEWLRYNFIEGPNAQNQYRGTKVIVKPY